MEPEAIQQRCTCPPSRRPGKRRRKGAAVAELAVCLPVMVVLVMGAIECTSMTFVQNSLQIVAYESIRTAIRNDATPAAVQARAAQVIAERSINNAAVTLSPSAVDQVQRGQPITVTVTVPAASNSVLPLQFFSGSLTARAVMIKE